MRHPHQPGTGRPLWEARTLSGSRVNTPFCLPSFGDAAIPTVILGGDGRIHFAFHPEKDGLAILL
jgi:hypothetical protein